MHISDDIVQIAAWVVPLSHLAGLLLAFDSIWRTRTSQGAIAWSLSLFSIPYAAVPLYLIFGRSRFHGYVRARKSKDAQLAAVADRSLRLVGRAAARAPLSVAAPAIRSLQHLARCPFAAGHTAELLVDGTATFTAIFAAIDNATTYILVQFFIVRDDEIGRELARRLAIKARAGVAVYFLYDEVGSRTASRRYWRELGEAGVRVSPFNTRRGGWRNRFQINFRNHRKIVIVDGLQAFVGGHNVGDDYLGRGPLGPWRDTHVSVRGPVVTAIQLCFVEDWHWATSEVIQLAPPEPSDCSEPLIALALPTGPADEVETCSLMFAQLIQSAQHRLWIASPYFVPDTQIMAQLKLAALRGVDVRILLPDKPDHVLTHLASFAYIAPVERVGVSFYKLTNAFPHQKVVLVDDAGVAIGTANLDNRSLRLNFEITLLFVGGSIAEATHTMLTRDFAAARKVTVGELDHRSFPFRLAVRIAHLFSPIL